MIIRQFLAWTQNDSASRRAEAASALTRAYLYDGLAPEAVRDAEIAILGLLDDPAPLVRRALAEACAGCGAAPRSLVVALAGDQPDIASVVLARSTVLTDADLVDGVAIGCAVTRMAIAGRHDLSYPVAGAMAEIAEPAVLAAMIRNRSARITTGSLLRIAERHGGDAALREALLARPGLPLEVRQAVTAHLAEALSAFAVSSGWLTPARSERASREARERTTLAFSIDAGPIDLARLVTHLRDQGQLNAGLILRAILSGRMAFAEAALAGLSGLGADRVAGLMQEPSGGGFAALHRRAGLAPALLPAFAAALAAWREEGRNGTGGGGGASLSRRMIERALTACETMPFAEAQSVMALLSRYEAEAAREEARAIAKAAVAQEELIAARRMEIEILDVEWREAQRQVAHWPEAPAVRAESTATQTEITADAAGASGAAEIQALAQGGRAAGGVGAADPVGAILDALPDAIRASLREDQERKRAAEADAVLEAIPDALVASYRADRERLRIAA